MLAALPSWALSLIKVTYAADVFWDANSAVLPAAQFKHVERIACQARAINLEVVIAVGHASADEKVPQALSEKRAAQVKARLVALGVPDERVYIEGKGARQPVAKEAAKNRRVELELVGTPGGGSVQNCVPQWQRDFLALPVAQALTVARAQVREGWIDLPAPHRVAIDRRRLDLLDALLSPDSGVVLSAADKEAIFVAAAQSWNVPALERIVRSGFHPRSAAAGLPLVAAACGGSNGAPAGAAVETVQALLNWGAGVAIDTLDTFSRSALGCAAGRGNLQLTDLLLQAGADPNPSRTEPPIVQAGHHRQVVARLLKGGADPKARSAAGKTLLHSYRLQDASEVEWLVSLGLGVNDVDAGSMTALQHAISYATVDVLDALARAGASMGDESRMTTLYSWSARNPAARVWLIDRGIALKNPPALILSEIEAGDARLPVVRALMRRGVSPLQWNAYGESSLALAIRQLAPELVELLLREGADTRQPTQPPVRQDATALELARRQPLQVFPVICIHCSGDSMEEAVRKANTPELLADRQARKNRIVQMLEAQTKP